MISPASVVDRLFHRVTRRAPTVEERAAIDDALASSLEEIPEVFVDALDGLLAQAAGEHTIPEEAAAWSWVVQGIADLVPGAKVAWEGNTWTLTLPGHALVLTIDGNTPARYRVERAIVKRLAVDGQGRYVLAIPPELEPLLAACEIFCVAGCCGTGAFSVTPDAMQAWLAKSGGAGTKAAACLDEIVAELESAPERSVVSYRIGAVWPAREPCAAYLRTWRACLGEAMAR